MILKRVMMKTKLQLYQCVECGRTFNPLEIGTSETKCATHNQKQLDEKRKKDNERKSSSRNDKVSSNLEKLGDIDE